MTIDINKALERALNAQGLTESEALAFTELPESEIFSILAHTEKIRERFKGNEVDLCGIVNAKSGACAEDCSFCSQSSSYDADVPNYPMLGADAMVEAARKAKESGAREFSIVTSGTGVDAADEVDSLKEAVAKIGSETALESCVSIGIVSEETLTELKDAGLHSYHHNLETSRSFFPSICTTHDYEDDVATVRRAKALGLHVCSGGVFGLGEGWKERVELALTLRELDVDSVPINFLNPRPGTPLEKASNLSPLICLKIIALYRFMLPTKDIVICGGRPTNLRDLQSLIFAAGANGMMIGDYLTTAGRSVAEDMRMIADLGLKARK